MPHQLGIRSLARKLLLIAISLGAVACPHPGPTLEQRLDYGFNTPMQAFESFRTAVQGHLLAEEYRCFSTRWKNANELGSFNYYSEVRDATLAKVPHLLLALIYAKDLELVVNGREARIMGRVPGPLWIPDRWLVVDLEREGYWDVWTNDKPKKPTEGYTVHDPLTSGLLEYDEGDDSLRVNVDHFSVDAPGLDLSDVLAVKAGWQWKISDFQVHEDEGATH